MFKSIYIVMCKKCDENPKAHSFYKLAIEDGKSIFYSCPAQAEDYNDVDGILEHILEKLGENQGKDWIYIFDGKGFELKHAMEIRLLKGIIAILDNNKQSLKEIRIINTSVYVEYLMNVLHPILPDCLSSKINWKK
tara:strand:+ start:297 stop:704 length:408 start_codon:yes stop_codon:yes gene_type:complete